MVKQVQREQSMCTLPLDPDTSYPKYRDRLCRKPYCVDSLKLFFCSLVVVGSVAVALLILYFTLGDQAAESDTLGTPKFKVQENIASQLDRQGTGGILPKKDIIAEEVEGRAFGDGANREMLVHEKTTFAIHPNQNSAMLLNTKPPGLSIMPTRVINTQSVSDIDSIVSVSPSVGQSKRFSVTGEPPIKPSSREMSLDSNISDKSTSNVDIFSVKSTPSLRPTSSVNPSVAYLDESESTASAARSEIPPATDLYMVKLEGPKRKLATLSNVEVEVITVSSDTANSDSLAVVVNNQMGKASSTVSNAETGRSTYKEDVNIGVCRDRRYAFCDDTLPYNTTILPNVVGDTSYDEVNRSLPYFEFILRSECNFRIKQLVCAILEPECKNNRPVAPCRKFCRVATQGCEEYILAALELSQVFQCQKYPDSNNPNVCVNLAQKVCLSGEFQCPDKACIPKRWQCDGIRDCIYAADEANCNACTADEYQCDQKCVPSTWRCDGEPDCLDGSDERGCPSEPVCEPDRFQCTDGSRCITRRWVCDGQADCTDESDERECSKRECAVDDFRCNNGICIPPVWRCDGQSDCKDNSDELNCESVRSRISTTTNRKASQ
ncbi:uncharacterized protein LOC143249294 isoform X2 [Tachypleus tridentatus]|uniref:uncharacterized protein LOC143249294 isoform X2 n=1 Tax=Tachypleus tridentatus TaxID=6853 RepID=UPI003FD26EDA